MARLESRGKRQLTLLFVFDCRWVLIRMHALYRPRGGKGGIKIPVNEKTAKGEQRRTVRQSGRGPGRLLSDSKNPDLTVVIDAET